MCGRSLSLSLCLTLCSAIGYTQTHESSMYWLQMMSHLQSVSLLEVEHAESTFLQFGRHDISVQQNSLDLLKPPVLCFNFLTKQEGRIEKLKRGGQRNFVIQSTPRRIVSKDSLHILFPVKPLESESEPEVSAAFSWASASSFFALFIQHYSVVHPKRTNERTTDGSWCSVMAAAAAHMR